VSGRLTRNGAAVPDGEYRGSLIFALDGGGSRSMTSFSDTGDATYRGEVFAGSYDVRYQPSGSCRSSGPLPCQSVMLRSKVSLVNTGALDLDAKVVSVSGRLTKNGATVPDGEYRGSLIFALVDGGSRSMTSFSDTGDATYRGEVFAGTYDVRYQPSGSCRSSGPLPCQSATLRAQVALSDSGALDLDAKVARVSGRLTRNGAAVPDGEYRGYLIFSLDGGGSRSMSPFSDTGAATYQGEVFAGSYDVRYQPSGSCRSSGPLPCQPMLIKGCPMTEEM
jgi:uncharacterized Zn-binding protein involved in type VI secretion